MGQWNRNFPKNIFYRIYLGKSVDYCLIISSVRQWEKFGKDGARCTVDSLEDLEKNLMWNEKAESDYELPGELF